MGGGEEREKGWDGKKGGGEGEEEGHKMGYWGGGARGGGFLRTRLTNRK